MADKKKPTTEVRTENGGLTICIAYTFEDPMDAIVWRSYIQEGFFTETLAKHKEGEKELIAFLKQKGHTGADIAKLRTSLNHTGAEDLMKHLREFTHPKLFINSAWVEW